MSASAAGGPRSTSNDYNVTPQRPHGTPLNLPPTQVELENRTQNAANEALNKSGLRGAYERNIPVRPNSEPNFPRMKIPPKKADNDPSNKVLPLNLRNTSKITQNSFIPGVRQQTLEESIDKVKSVLNRIPTLMPKGTGKMFDRGWEETKEKLSRARDTLSRTTEKGKNKTREGLSKAKERVTTELTEAKKNAKADLKKAKEDFGNLGKSITGAISKNLSPQIRARNKEIQALGAEFRIMADSKSDAKNVLDWCYDGTAQIYEKDGKFYVMVRDNGKLTETDINSLSQNDYTKFRDELLQGLNKAESHREADIERMKAQGNYHSAEQEKALQMILEAAKNSKLTEEQLKIFGETRKEVEHYSVTPLQDGTYELLVIDNEGLEYPTIMDRPYMNFNDYIYYLTGKDLEGLTARDLGLDF